MWQQVLHKVLIGNKFYIATRKQVFPMRQQVLHLMASVQYLKTSFICGNKYYVRKILDLDVTKFYIRRTSIFDAKGILLSVNVTLKSDCVIITRPHSNDSTS